MKARARHTDPETSHEAAAKVNVPKAVEICLRTLRGGRVLSSWEIAEENGLPGRDHMSPRMVDIERIGLIERHGKRRPPGKSRQIGWRRTSLTLAKICRDHPNWFYLTREERNAVRTSKGIGIELIPIFFKLKKLR